MIDQIISKNYIYLIFLIIPSYALGIAITEIFVFLTIILFFFYNRNVHLFKDKKIIFLLFFSLLASVSGLKNLEYDDLKLASIFHIRFVLLSLAIIYFFEKIIKNKSLNTNFLNLFLIIILFIIFDSIIQFLIGTNLFGQEIQNHRVSGIFGNELVLGSFLLYALPLTLSLLLLFDFDIKKKQIYLVLFFSFYLIAIYISAGRTPIFLTILFLIIIFFFEKKFRKIILKCLSIFVLFVICEANYEFGKTRLFHKVFFITFIQITDHFYHPPDNPNNELTSQKEKMNKKELSFKNKTKNFFDSLVVFSDDHQNHYLLALKLFKEKPIIGNGPKGFRNYCRNVKYDPPVGICSTHPHNLFFQILSELGLVGIFFYLLGIFFLVYKLINSFLFKKKSQNNSLFIIITVGLLILIFPITPSGNFFNNWISIVNYYYIGIYIYLYNQIYS